MNHIRLILYEFEVKQISTEMSSIPSKLNLTLHLISIFSITIDSQNRKEYGDREKQTEEHKKKNALEGKGHRGRKSLAGRKDEGD